MADIYVDINNAYTATGDGSSGTPYNLSQFILNIRDIDEDVTYNVRGLRVENNDMYILSQNQTHNIDIIIQPWDIAVYGLPVFCSIKSGGEVFYDDMNGYANTVIDNIVFIGDYVYIISEVARSNDRNITCNTCHIISTLLSWASSYTWSLGGYNKTIFNGCIFFCDEFYNTYYSSAGTNEMNDCYFCKTPTWGDITFYRMSFTTLKRCYFEDATSRSVFDITTSNYYHLDDLSGSNTCVFSYTPTNSVLETLQPSYGSYGYVVPSDIDTDLYVYSNRSDLDYNLFGLPTITDSSIINEWIAGGYDTGLFGEARLSIGAFYYEPPIPPGPPVADFYASNRVGAVPFEVTFTDNSTGDITERTWFFGDGETSQGNDTVVTHIYSETGIYDVELYVEGTEGTDRITKERYIVAEAEVFIPNMIIAESESSALDKYWKFYIDAERHLVFETETLTYRSKDKIIEPNRWTFVEFHPLYKKMYVGDIKTSHREIQIITTYTILPESPTTNRLLVAYNSSITLDELRIFDKEIDFKPYFNLIRGHAATLR